MERSVEDPLLPSSKCLVADRCSGFCLKGGRLHPVALKQKMRLRVKGIFDLKHPECVCQSLQGCKFFLQTVYCWGSL